MGRTHCPRLIGRRVGCRGGHVIGLEIDGLKRNDSEAFVLGLLPRITMGQTSGLVSDLRKRTVAAVVPNQGGHSTAPGPSFLTVSGLRLLGWTASRVPAVDEERVAVVGSEVHHKAASLGEHVHGLVEVVHAVIL